MNTVNQALSALRRIGIVIAIAIAFLFGLATTVYLSLRSPEVKVPEVVGKDRFEAEHILGDAGLNFRVRATRPSRELRADTVLFQLPRAGEVVKAGQTVAMDISRTAKEGESPEAIAIEKKESKTENQDETSASAANENKPKRYKNANKNANDNSNTNTLNRNANANRALPNGNVNIQNANAVPNANSVGPASNGNANLNRSSNQNENRRPPAPKPSPGNKPTPVNP